jgi:hypothetical protein
MPQRRAIADGAVFDKQHRPRSRFGLAARAIGATTTTRPSANGRAQRGTNALIIEEILKAMAPSAARPAEIRKALQDNGVAISFPSIHHALRQLEARNAAEQVGDSKSWRHRDGAA